MDQDISNADILTFKDENVMLKDKVAHLQSQLEQSENESMIAAELGKRLLEEKENLESILEEERATSTAKIEELTQENFNLVAKTETRPRLFDVISEEHENENKLKKEHEQIKEEIKMSYEKKLNEMKKMKLAVDEEFSNFKSQMNLKLQQKEETIEDIQKTNSDLKSKIKTIEAKSCLEGENQELKTAFQECYEEKCQIEENLKECVHMLQSKNLENKNLTKRNNELKEELEYAQKEQVQYHNHLEDSKNMITELKVEISQLETELNSGGHSKRGNSLFAELEDKRVAAERNLAIFKVRYNSLQKAHESAKKEILRMKHQVLAFLQTRSDRADSSRIEYLERAVSEKIAECNTLTAKLKQKEQLLLARDPLSQLKELIQSQGEPDSPKDYYIQLLVVNAEDDKKKIDSLVQEIKAEKFAHIAKTDELRDTQRKLYTAINTSDKNRNENLRTKIHLEEIKNKFEEEKRKRLEFEDLIKKLSNGKASYPNEHSVENENEKPVLTSKICNKPEKREDRKRKKDCTEEKNIEISKSSKSDDCVFVPRELTETEKKEKAKRLMRKFLPKELAEEYIRKKESQDANGEREQSENPAVTITRKPGHRIKSRKVSFKDEVEDLENGQKLTELNSDDKKEQAVWTDEEKNLKTSNANDDESKQDCKVQ